MLTSCYRNCNKKALIVSCASIITNLEIKERGHIFPDNIVEISVLCGNVFCPGPDEAPAVLVQDVDGIAGQSGLHLEFTDIVQGSRQNGQCGQEGDGQ